MPLYISDYLGDTSHLTTIEHGAYMLLIMTYWQRGKALPSESERLANIARMQVADWLKIEATIGEFFTPDGGTWRHDRIEKDLAKARERSSKARASGKASADKRGNERSTFVEQTSNERSTNVQPYPSSSLKIDKTASNSTEQEPARDEPEAARKQDFKFDRKAWKPQAQPAGKDRFATLRENAEGFGIDVKAHQQTVDRKSPENPFGYLRSLIVKDLRVWMPDAADALFHAALKGDANAKKVVFEAMTSGGVACPSDKRLS